MNAFKVTGEVKRFPGQNGWYYVELSNTLSEDLRPLLKSRWPALLRASFKVKSTKWDSSIMPITNGPLFIALPAKIRRSENIEVGNTVTIEFELKP